MVVAVSIVIVVLIVYSVLITFKCENALTKCHNATRKYAMLIKYIWDFQDQDFEKFKCFLKSEDLEKTE